MWKHTFYSFQSYVSESYRAKNRLNRSIRKTLTYHKRDLRMHLYVALL